MFKILFTLKVHYRGADVPSGEVSVPDNRGTEGVMAGYVTEAEGDRCVSRMCFQCEYDTY